MQALLTERMQAFIAFHMPSELFNPLEHTVMGLDIIKIDALHVDR
jgi:hypothetical protein